MSERDLRIEHGYSPDSFEPRDEPKTEADQGAEEKLQIEHGYILDPIEPRERTPDPARPPRPDSGSIARPDSESHETGQRPSEPLQPLVGGDPLLEPNSPLVEPIPLPVVPATVETETAASPELQPIADYVRGLARAVKSARMYPTNNPIYLRSVTDVLDKLNRAFQAFNQIRIVVGQTRLYFQGELVYENADPEDSLSRLFFRDGLREISFHVGLDREEMARFLEMIREALARDASEDLVTQLWDRSLPHITYTAIDDMLDADLSDNPVPPEFGSDFMNYVDFEMDFADDEAEPTRDAALAAAGEMHRKLMESEDSRIVAISDDEQAGLAGEAAGEDPTSLMKRGLDTLFEVIELEADGAPRERYLSVVQEVLTSVMAQKQFDLACHILESLEELAGRRADLVEAHAATLKAIRGIARDAAHLEIVTEILEKSAGSQVPEIERYLKLLSPEAIPDLCEILGRVESRRGRTVMCNVLIHMARGRIDPFLPFLRDERWFLVRNILAILGEMKNPSAVKHIRPLVGHAEIRVRREALSALSLIGEREAVEALVTSLRDSDFRIRVSAARSLSRLGRTGLNPILQIVVGRDFERRTLEEKRGFFEALGRTNAPELIQFLRVLLNKRPLFRKEEAEEMRVCAVEALARMKGPEVKALLAEAGRDPSSTVRAAVAGAMKRREEGDNDDV